MHFFRKEEDKKILRSNLAKAVWWWQLGYNKECTPDSVTKLVSEVNKRSMQVEQFFVMWVGSLIIWFKPNWDVNNLSFKPSFALLSFEYQLAYLALKSPLQIFFPRENSMFKHTCKCFIFKSFKGRYDL